MQQVEQKTTLAGPTSRGWRVWVLIATVLIGCLAVAGLYVLRHYKVGYFADYQSGYAAVSPDATTVTGTHDPACDTAARAAYPDLFKALPAEATWPQNAQAFYAGCSQKLAGQPADVWSMHGYLTSGRD